MRRSANYLEDKLRYKQPGACHTLPTQYYDIAITAIGYLETCKLIQHPSSIQAKSLQVALRAGQISPDIRSNAIGLLRILPVQDTIQYIYPSLWELHTMPTECGTLDENGNMQFPPALNLSFEKIQNHGLYLMFDNQSIYIFIGSQAHPQLVKDVFDKGDYGQIPAGKVLLNICPQQWWEANTILQMPLPLLENDFSQRVNNLIVSLRENSVYHPHIYIVKQEGGDPGLLNLFFSLMVEDRMEILNSYPQFLTTLRERIQAA